MKINIEFPRKLLEVYNDTCKPLCKKLKLPQTIHNTRQPEIS